ncbi:TPA: hypothetical protein ACKP1E_000614 [Pseudomonas aeruginosa]|uniref:hypothetical protein n=1 Tax=Pseudomonas aeruginosa TaxID=287 RepID=UPI000FD2DA31|nr:hypothetical protein [Pseudomonas aeruginosa]MBG6687156.1 hypothetical protein [Pseudomonas aeruginosa]MBG6723059.1 hypothetical protein [Pseudomonas aeruginosa]MBH9015193.1 hypothetical protein [Pseudomonas aeruginosa]MBI8339383.1 hypothetical protein [Pseudomonas aeruginosa]MBN5535467.1 hypothetical protein [Pseudomonas aeruginosa]
MKSMIVSALAAALALTSATASAIEHQSIPLVIAQASKPDDVLPKEKHLALTYFVILLEVDAANAAEGDLTIGADESIDAFTRRLAKQGKINTITKEMIHTTENNPGISNHWDEFGIPVQNGGNLSAVSARTGYGISIKPIVANGTDLSALPAPGITTNMSIQLNLPTGDDSLPNEKNVTFTDVFKKDQAHSQSWEQLGKRYYFVVRLTKADPFSYPSI